MNRLTNQTFSNLITILQSIDVFPVSDQKVSVDQYIQLYNENSHLQLIQFFSIEDYKNLIQNLIQRFYSSSNKNEYFKIIMDSFFFYLKDESVYNMYITFLDKAKQIYSDNTEEISVIQHFICDVYKNSYDTCDIYLEDLPEKADVNSFFSIFPITKFKQKHMDFEDLYAIDKEMKKVLNIIFENSHTELNQFKLWGSYLLFFTNFAYNSSRLVVYSQLNREKEEEFFTMLFFIMSEIKHTMFSLIKSGSVFPIAFHRISSFISAYYNIRIKRSIDIYGRKSQQTRLLINEYLDDLIFIKDVFLDYISFKTMQRTLFNFIEIINFYRYIDIDPRMSISTKNHTISGFRQLLRPLIIKTMRENSFLSVMQKYKDKYKLSEACYSISDDVLFEIGLIISSISLVNEDYISNNIQKKKEEDIFINAFYELNTVYEEDFPVHSTQKIDLDYIWK